MRHFYEDVLGLPIVAVRTSRLSCRKDGKAPLFTPGRESYGESPFIEVLKMPHVLAKYRALSVEPGGQSPAESAAFVKDETRIWGDVIKKNNIVVD